MSVRRSIKNVVEDYNCFGGHCPECDDFLFTYVLSFNPPIIKQCCLGCDFERDVSEEIKKAINYNNKSGSKVQKDYFRDANGYKRGTGDFIKPRNFAKKQLDEMVKESDPVQEYIDDIINSISLSYPQMSGNLKESAPMSYHTLGLCTTKLEKPGNHVRICKTCGYMIPDDIPVQLQTYFETKSIEPKKIIIVKCPACNMYNTYIGESNL